MKQWTVYFRDKNGSKASVVIEAEDRAGVFAELKKRGISAISVAEGASNKKPRKVAKNSASSKGRGLIAAAVLVLVAGVAAWWMWPEEKKVVEEPTKKKAAIKQVNVVTNRQVVKVVEKEEIDPKKMPHPMYKQPTNPKLPKKKYIPTVEEIEKARLGPDGKPRKMSIYKTPVEQALGMIFTTELGSPPPRLFDIPSFATEEQLKKFLDTTFAYDKDASDAVNENRIMMQQVQDEFKKYLDDGGDVKGFVDYYVGELHASYDQWKTAQKMIINMVKDGERPEVVKDVRDKVNALLSERGIKKLAFPPSIRSAMGEE